MEGSIVNLPFSPAGIITLKASKSLLSVQEYQEKI
jgi:hypothetical protein